ncbi:LytR/AlgR family response regulator transcription factor [Tuberibacillus sp. Marseille-P3662]|uniref:LytR/AlgR family response regulator transcription factor n=1 Tax=Tuberibacillus sp. Marseille-P3662 TaxID=1965358 RepID=UPI000A1CC990|nr:LytTR family DNA-binding domain-containing protein [Tuberibacillus sp. Marseille-P3662]
MKTIIIDDERHAREELKHLLSEYPDIEIVAEAASGEKALELITSRQPQLTFIDIEMGGLSGMDLASTLDQLKHPPVIVFATAYPDYAAHAFRVNAIDYLLKPFAEEELAETIERVKQRLNPLDQKQNRHRTGKLAVETSDKIHYLHPNDILFVNREERDTKIHTSKQVFDSKLTLKDLEEKLSGHPFYRTHKSFLVNLQHVQAISPWFNGAYQLKIYGYDESIPVSRNYVKGLREQLEL